MLAWRMDCSNNLTVTIAVADKYILLLSDDAAVARTPWRLGTYMDAQEAQRRAVEMTGSYERLRKGIVGQYAEVIIPARQWRQLVMDGEVSGEAAHLIEEALSTAVSPVDD